MSDALRYNEGKPQWSLVDFDSLIPLVRVLESGKAKYELDNWKKNMPLDEIMNSAMRHITALSDGELLDKESGLEHAGHAMANLMFYIYHSKARVQDCPVLAVEAPDLDIKL